MMDGDVSIAAVRSRLLAEHPFLEEIRKRRPLYFEKLARGVRDCAEFNQRHVLPAALELDRRLEKDHTYEAWDIVRGGMEYRFLSLIIPKLVGGLGGLATLYALVMEEMCSACPGVANIFGAHSLGIAPLLVAGSISHWETTLREVADGEKKGVPIIMALAITEPSAGTDAEEPHFLSGARLSMQAKKVCGGYVLNGRKCFISNGSIARYIWVTAAIDRRHPAESWTGFLVDREMEGFSVARVEEKMGQRACPAAELAFEDCFVPDENVVGFEGDGMQPGTLLTMAGSRAPVGAIGTGIARGAYEWFLRWAKRPRGGRKPLQEQGVQMALADMRAHIHFARWAYLSGALAFDNSLGAVMNGVALTSLRLLPKAVRTSRPFYRFFLSSPGKQMSALLMSLYTSNQALTRSLAFSSLAKFAGGDAAMFVTSLALEYMGSEPCEEKLWVEKAFRDAKLTQIYEGTNQLNRLTLFMTDIERSLAVELHKPLRRAYGAEGVV